MDETVGVLNNISPNTMKTERFSTLAEGISSLAKVAETVDLSGE
jgi:hypothetical protein